MFNWANGQWFNDYRDRDSVSMLMSRSFLCQTGVNGTTKKKMPHNSRRKKMRKRIEAMCSVLSAHCCHPTYTFHDRISFFNVQSSAKWCVHKIKVWFPQTPTVTNWNKIMFYYFTQAGFSAKILSSFKWHRMSAFFFSLVRADARARTIHISCLCNFRCQLL